MDYSYVGYNVGRYILPYLTVIIPIYTCALFLSGISTCRQIRQLGCSDSLSALPFLIGSLSCAFGLQYGLIKEDNVIILCNLVGCLLQTLYTIYYCCNLRSTRQRILACRAAALELALIASMIYGVHAYPGQTIEFLFIGCISLMLGTLIGPLASIRQMIRTKSASESIRPSICWASFLVSAQWLLYGIIVDDFIIRVPNYVATPVWALHLSLFLIYPSSQLSPLPSHNCETL